MKTHRLKWTQRRRLRITQVRRWVYGSLSDLALVGGMIVIAEWTCEAWVRTDWQGFLIFAIVAAVGIPVFFGRSFTPLSALVLWAGKSAGRGFRNRFNYQFGFTFRKARRDPPFLDLTVSVGFLFLLTAGALALSPLTPAFIHTLLPLSGTAYLIVLGVFWLLLLTTLMTAFVGLFIYVQAVRTEGKFHDNPIAARVRKRKSRRLTAILVFSFCLAVCLEIFFGARGLFFVLLALTGVHLGLALLPRWGTSPGLLIRRTDRGRLAGIGLFPLEHYVLTAACTWAVALLAGACGWKAVPSPLALPLAPQSAGGATAGTELLGHGSAIAAFLFLFPITLRALRVNLTWRKRDPARPRKKILTHPPGALERPCPFPWHFRPTRSAPPRSRADLDYDPDAVRARPGTAPPLKRRLEGVDGAERLFLLNHFDYITKRRRFYRGFSKLLKIASAHTFSSGGGFLLAPHHFFIEGLHRDDPGGEEGESRIIGPPFAVLWEHRTRQFLYEVLTGLDIDLVFFEDAVKWPHLRRVFDQAFERYMQNPRGGPVQESEFRLLQGVKVFIDEVDPESSLKTPGGYSEPEFANLFAARVLMVFKDRGGAEERDRQPSPKVRVPMPLFGS
ncbi:MAG: hypothetical protein ACYTHM_01580 [Planctomycetota bacterium]|jgi:hypothetical protein